MIQITMAMLKIFLGMNLIDLQNGPLFIHAVVSNAYTARGAQAEDGARAEVLRKIRALLLERVKSNP